MDVGRSGTTRGATDLPLEEPLDPDRYVCGSGDSFELRFWGKQNMSIAADHGPRGPHLHSEGGQGAYCGKVSDAGPEAGSGCRAALLPRTKVDLSLVKAREFMVHVVGDVKEPGLYKSNARRRVSAIVAQAGGATGSIRRIEVRRRRGEPTVADLLLYKPHRRDSLQPVSARWRRDQSAQARSDGRDFGPGPRPGPLRAGRYS